VGREFNPASAKAPSRPGGAVLEVRFPHVSFTLRAGEILGLAGLLGAGRTEIANAICGLTPAREGEILIHGRRVRIQSPADALRHGIAVVTEDRKRFGFVPDMSIRENVTLSSLRRYCSGPFIRSGAEARVADEQIRRFAVSAAGRDQQVKYLSGG